MSSNTDQNELGGFLRARRSELSPSDVDLPEGGRQRRVAGLRREEIAQLAAISTDYYTRLEQGRISPSAPVFASLARVLRLDEDQRTYMNELVGSPATAKSRRLHHGAGLAFRASASRARGVGSRAHRRVSLTRRALDGMTSQPHRRVGSPNFT